MPPAQSIVTNSSRKTVAFVPLSLLKPPRTGILDVQRYSPGAPTERPPRCPYRTSMPCVESICAVAIFLV
eukprot:6212597-Pleurochrysis_carterae.AAC.1